jgi:heat shock protein HtpX
MYNQIAANKRKSIIIMVFFAAFASFIAFVAGTYLGGRSVAPYAILAALLYVVISYFAGSKLALAVNSAHEVTKKEEPRLYRTVENLAITDGMPTPRIYVMEDPAPNAFATGRDPNHAVVCATRGLLNMMNDSELEGVMAHELGHVKNYDIRVSLLAFALASVIGLISDFVLRMWFWGGGRDDDGPGSNPIFMAVGIIAIVLSPIVAALIQTAVSRQREYLADATGALTTRYPDGLASALEKIAQHGSVLRRQNSSTAHLFFANPLKGKSLSNLFSTHPPIQDRIDRLRQMGGKS